MRESRNQGRKEGRNTELQEYRKEGVREHRNEGMKGQRRGAHMEMDEGCGDTQGEIESCRDMCKAVEIVGWI